MWPLILSGWEHPGAAVLQEARNAQSPRAASLHLCPTPGSSFLDIGMHKYPFLTFPLSWRPGGKWASLGPASISIFPGWPGILTVKAYSLIRCMNECSEGGDWTRCPGSHSLSFMWLCLFRVLFSHVLTLHLNSQKPILITDGEHLPLDP